GEGAGSNDALRVGSCRKISLGKIRAITSKARAPARNRQNHRVPNINRLAGRRDAASRRKASVGSGGALRRLPGICADALVLSWTLASGAATGGDDSDVATADARSGRIRRGSRGGSDDSSRGKPKVS